MPYSGYPLGMSDNERSMRGALASANRASEGGASPHVVRTPTAVDKRRGPRSSTSKFRGVSCYKRCVLGVGRRGMGRRSQSNLILEDGRIL